MTRKEIIDGMIDSLLDARTNENISVFIVVSDSTKEDSQVGLSGSKTVLLQAYHHISSEHPEVIQLATLELLGSLSSLGGVVQNG
jgi:hypothetical protein